MSAPRPDPGRPSPVAPGIVRILADNPSPMTHWGTNSYLLGEADLALIDPGPALERHRAALLAAIGGRPVRAILVTHAHRDHADLAADLGQSLKAPVLAYGDAASGRSAAMTALAAAAEVGGGEGVSAGFRPDARLADGETVTGADWALTALHTPGHFGNHMCFVTGGTGFSGDLVMGWASTLISPPDGDLADFRASCARLSGLGLERLLPGHGPPVESPAERIAWLLAHREERERQILSALAGGPARPAELARAIYTDTAPALLPAATRNVLAHLIDLVGRGRVEARPAPGPEAVFALAPAR